MKVDWIAFRMCVCDGNCRALLNGLVLLFLLALCPLRSLSHFPPSTIETVTKATLTDRAQMRALCRSVSGLTESQRQWCVTHPPFLRPISLGARLGLEECKRQFTFERWNCPIAETPNYLKVIEQASRETAFVTSIQSAGVMLAVARTCSEGKGVQDFCSCDTSVKDDTSNNGEWEWGGCGDNFEKGEQFGREFLDGPHSGKTRKQADAMEVHNNNVGRLAVKDSLHRRCKCHGLTGTCTVKYCWKSLPKVQKVGIVLKEKYRNAQKVKTSADTEKRIITIDTEAPVEPRDLVFLRESPDYCRRNISVGSLGTAGRECREESRGDDGCELLCCGNGHYTKRSVIREKCQCKFIWCCRVECRQCLKAWETFHCNKPSTQH